MHCIHLKIYKTVAIIGDIIRQAITAPIKEDRAFFSLIGDELTEKHSRQEISSVCLRFVEWNDQSKYHLPSLQ